MKNAIDQTHVPVLDLFSFESFGKLQYNVNGARGPMRPFGTNANNKILRKFNKAKFVLKMKNKYTTLYVSLKPMKRISTIG